MLGIIGIALFLLVFRQPFGFMALLGTIGGSLAAAMADAKCREAALITFLAAAANITLLGIGGAFLKTGSLTGVGLGGAGLVATGDVTGVTASAVTAGLGTGVGAKVQLANSAHWRRRTQSAWAFNAGAWSAGLPL